MSGIQRNRKAAVQQDKGFTERYGIRSQIIGKAEALGTFFKMDSAVLQGASPFSADSGKLHAARQILCLCSLLRQEGVAVTPDILQLLVPAEIQAGQPVAAAVQADQFCIPAQVQFRQIVISQIQPLQSRQILQAFRAGNIFIAGIQFCKGCNFFRGKDAISVRVCIRHQFSQHRVREADFVQSDNTPLIFKQPELRLSASAVSVQIIGIGDTAAAGSKDNFTLGKFPAGNS